MLALLRQRRHGGAFYIAVALLLATVGFYSYLMATGQWNIRDIHLGTAVHYAKTSFGLDNTLILGFNATNTPTIQEIPIWQMVAGGMIRVFNGWWGGATITSLLFYFLGVFPLFWLVARRLGERLAWYSVAFFAAQPLVFLFSGRAGVDGACLTGMIWFWYAGDRLLERPTVGRWVVAAGFGALAAMLKLPFFATAGLALFFLLLKEHRGDVRRWVALGGVGAFSALLFFAWTKVTDHYQANAVYPLVDLRVSKNPQMLWWFFGDWAYRLNPMHWIKGGWRVLNGLFGNFAFVALACYGGLSKAGGGRNAFAWFLLLGGLVTTAVFSHLVLHHAHYYLMLAPAVAVLMAQGAAALEDRLALEGVGKRIGLAVAILGLGLSLVQGMVGLNMTLVLDRFPSQMGRLLAQHTTPEDKIVAIRGDWGGRMFLEADRRGLSIWGPRFFEKPEQYARLKELGFTKLVIFSESPVQHAGQQSKSTSIIAPRRLYQDDLTPLVSSWPTVFEAENMIIKEIPNPPVE